MIVVRMHEAMVSKIKASNADLEGKIIEEEKILEASSTLLKEGNSKKSIAKALSKVSQYSVNEIYTMIQHY